MSFLIVLLYMQLAPRDKLKFSALELMDGRPIPQAREKGHLSPFETEQLKCVLQVGETMKALTEHGNQVLPTPTELALYAFWHRAWVHLKIWKISSLKGQLTPKWNGAHLVTLTTHSALKLKGGHCT